MRQLSTILIGLLFLTSCDCYQVVTGTVIDKETRTPIKGVTVYNKTKPTTKTETNQDGTFELSSISGGLFGCPPMKIVIEHFDYQIQETEIPAGGQKEILLTKRKGKTELNADHIKNIKYVFDDYIQYQESTDSPEDKDLMTKSLKSLTKVTDKDDLDLLINVWIYYDPTDYPDIPEIYRILKASRPHSIEAVKSRIENKKEWETDDTAPYSDLKNLLKRLENE